MTTPDAIHNLALFNEGRANAYIWHIIRTSPQNEARVQKTFQRAGVETILPLEERYRYARRFRGPKVRKEYPRLPTYLISGFPGPVNWLAVREVIGVTGVVLVDGKPLALTAKSVAEIAAWGGEHVNPARPSERFMISRREYQEGDVVEVMDGVFEGLSATVVEIGERETTALVRLFGNDIPAQFEIGDLAKR